MSPRQVQVRDLLIRVDTSRSRSVGRQLEDQLRSAIRSGSLTAGSELPSTRALAEDLGLSRGVVVRSYTQLAAEGYVDLRQGMNPRVRQVPRPVLVATAERLARKAPKIRYDLRAHQPDVAAFPRQAWLRSLRHAMKVATDADLGYIESFGIERLRTAISDYLGRARGVAADPSRTIITTGCTHALGLIAHVLAREGASRIAVENPSHRLVRTAVERGGLTPVATPVDSSGFCTDHLPEEGVDAVLVSPAHQFPTGAALTADRRSDLITWARNSSGLIIEDDYDAEFRYDRAPIGALQGLSPDTVAYIGSTAKTLAPGIRLGWAVLPPKLHQAVADELDNSMRHVSGIEQLALADFVTRGDFDRHLRQMRAIYKRRRDLLVTSLAKHLPALPVTGIAAGLHVILELPSSDLEERTYSQALEKGILLHPLSRHLMPGYDGPAGMLIGYGAVSDAAIPHVVEQLATVIRTTIGQNGTQARRTLGSTRQ